MKTPFKGKRSKASAAEAMVARDQESNTAEQPVGNTLAPVEAESVTQETQATLEAPAPESNGETAPAEVDKPKRKIGEHRSAYNKQRKLPEDHIIHLLVNANPKRPGSASAERFGWHQDGITVGEYIKLSMERGTPRTLANADVRWDFTKKFIDVVPPPAKD